MKKEILIVPFISLALLAAGCNKTTSQSPPSPEITETTKQRTTVDTNVNNSSGTTGAIVKNTDTASDGVPTTTHGKYQDYSPDTVKTEQAAGHKLVLFFHADWCPFCVEADKQFKLKADQIPQGVTVLKTNYDAETALKKKYVITYQHTLVQIDGNGNLVSKWNGGDVDNLKKYLK